MSEYYVGIIVVVVLTSVVFRRHSRLQVRNLSVDCVLCAQYGFLDIRREKAISCEPFPHFGQTMDWSG